MNHSLTAIYAQFSEADKLVLAVLILSALLVFLWVNSKANQIWKDSTQYDNGRYAILRLTKALLFYAGFGQVLASVVLDLLRSVAPGIGIIHLDTATGFTLIGLGFVGQGIKEATDQTKDFFDRRTKDDNNNALAVPPAQVPPGDVPPPLMPQAPTTIIV